MFITTVRWWPFWAELAPAEEDFPLLRSFSLPDPRMRSAPRPPLPVPPPSVKHPIMNNWLRVGILYFNPRRCSTKSECVSRKILILIWYHTIRPLARRWSLLQSQSTIFMVHCTDIPEPLVACGSYLAQRTTEEKEGSEFSSTFEGLLRQKSVFDRDCGEATNRPRTNIYSLSDEWKREMNHFSIH